GSLVESAPVRKRDQSVEAPCHASRACGLLRGPTRSRARPWGASRGGPNAGVRVSPEAKAVGAVRLRLALALFDLPRHRLPARLLVLPLAAELRPVGGPRARVRGPPELLGGAAAGRALPGISLEHRRHHRARADRRA